MNADELQRYWDRLLVEAFYKAPDAYMTRLLYQMQLDTNITFEELNKLKRTPRRALHQHMTITRFCSGYLPRLGAILWKYNKDNIEHVIGILEKWSGDTVVKAVDDHKDKERKSAQAAASKKARQFKTAKEVNRIISLKNSRSGWNVCKASHSKALKRH